MWTLDSWHKLDRAARGLAPFLTALLLMLVFMVPLHLPDFGMIAPSVALMAVFYWAVYRPDLMGPVAAGVLGLVQDVITGAPLGLYAFICLVTHASVASQRQLFQAHGFFILWWGFLLTALLNAALAWVLYSVLLRAFVPVEPVLFQALVSMALFPLLAWIFGVVKRSFLSEN